MTIEEYDVNMIKTNDFHLTTNVHPSRPILSFVQRRLVWGIVDVWVVYVTRFTGVPDP